MSFGCYNPFPFQLGGDERAIETVHRGLNEQYAKTFDVSDGTLADVESYAEAVVIACGWDAAARGGAQMRPLEMLEGLPIWERACGLRPSPSDLPSERRAELAAQFRGFAGNAEPDMRDVCAELMGANFVETSYIPPLSTVTYWPGMVPGPPMLPWFSNRCTLFVEVTKAGLSQEAFDRKTEKLSSVLSRLIPSWMDFAIFLFDSNGSDEGFILDLSLLDEAGLGA